ncbi:hypothetical protein F4805DRAFT_473998 [Annulohypoxylon moriforme]|nr:hypothetical protein F4805DRAFT_473998 [Annulohypoxylon moriforme]
MPPKLQYYQEPGYVIGTSVFLSVIDIIVVGLRFRVRRLQKLPLGPDDWIMIPALLITVLTAVDIIYGVSRKALACHTEIPPDANGDLTFETITDQILLSFTIGYVFNILFVLAVGLVKASVLFFYLRIFSIVSGRVRRMLIALITIVTMWTTAWLFESIFNCNLNFLAVQGTSQALRTKCVNFSVADLMLCITDFVIDIVIIIFPVPLIWNLNVSARRKIATSGIFLLGAATIATSLTRVVMSARIAAINLATDSDQVLTITVYIYWGMIECGIGIVVACLPTLAFLFKGFTCEPIITATKRLLQKVYSSPTSLKNDSVRVQSLIGNIYERKASLSTTSNSSLTPHTSSVIGNDHLHGPESYSLKEIVGPRESV